MTTGALVPAAAVEKNDVSSGSTLDAETTGVAGSAVKLSASVVRKSARAMTKQTETVTMLFFIVRNLLFLLISNLKSEIAVRDSASSAMEISYWGAGPKALSFSSQRKRPRTSGAAAAALRL